MSTAAPGWYDDGQHPGRLRYWDGTQWTDHFASSLPVAERLPDAIAFDPDYRPQHAKFPRNRPPVWPWVLAGSCIAFLVLVTVVTLAVIETLAAR
ncbi:MAG TPA: DUF2510 domain-containing protein [Microbacteriaceae bacterium]|nr:DUF2510 domain-containing protein [Microbacteriaceae bacterium]